ncbi:MAG: rhomboid family intramembrane serine protease [Dehalococcoidales bacterium]|nr:rhomboid family intramembrane serine protease [Dehalococcoidales bacterium]
MVLHWGRAATAVWGGATLGAIVGLIVALITGDWGLLALCFTIGTFAGTLFQWIGRLSNRSYHGFGLNPILVLIILNLLLFIATVIVPDIRPSLWLQPAGFLNRPWVILTSMFTHGSFWHIFTNMLTLFFFGSYLSRLVGQDRFLFVYFTGGILGNICYIVLTLIGAISAIGFLGSPFTPAVGASGAIFALAGALVVMRPRLTVFIFPIPVPIPLWIAVIGGFLILSFLPHIAWQAHLGGLVLGLVAGYFFRGKERYSF